MKETVQRPEEVNSEGAQGWQCFLCFSSCGPCQPANRLGTERPLCDLQCPFTFGGKNLHKCSNEDLQVQLRCVFLSSCAWLFLSEEIAPELPECVKVCTHARSHLHTSCERFQFSWAGSQIFCCFNAKYSPVTSLWGQEEGLIALFSCPVPLGLR